jgi:para-aminobenzoate synthetase/4-amino-4-deoxychorismate lyase
MSVWIDGRFLASPDVPGLDPGAVAPFETMGARTSQVPLWERHLARLAAAAARLGLPFAPPADLRASAGALLLQNGHADDVLRLSLVPSRGTVHTVLATRSRGPHRSFVRLLPTVVQRAEGAPPADLKAMPRRFHDAVLQQAQDGGADDGIVVGPDGAVLETALANLWLKLDGVWVTPPLDGRILPGIARALLLESAAAAGLRIEQRACTLDHLHRAEALATSNAVHGPRAASLQGGKAPPVAIVDSELGKLWGGKTSGFRP